MLTALALSPTVVGTQPVKTSVELDDNVYRISVVRAMQEFRCRFHDTDSIPEIELG